MARILPPASPARPCCPCVPRAFLSRRQRPAQCPSRGSGSGHRHLPSRICHSPRAQNFPLPAHIDSPQPDSPQPVPGPLIFSQDPYESLPALSGDRYSPPPRPATLLARLNGSCYMKSPNFASNAPIHPALFCRFRASAFHILLILN